MSNVTRFGAIGDGVADDTEAIQHAVTQGDGVLYFPPGNYRITQPIEIKLSEHGPLGIDGTGGTARVVMDGKGPAFRLVGTMAARAIRAAAMATSPHINAYQPSAISRWKARTRRLMDSN